MVHDFICTVHIKKVIPLKKDRLVWKVEKDGIFTVNSSFAQLEGGSQNSVPFKLLGGLLCLGSMVG